MATQDTEDGIPQDAKDWKAPDDSGRIEDAEGAQTVQEVKDLGAPMESIEQVKYKRTLDPEEAMRLAQRLDSTLEDNKGFNDVKILSAIAYEIQGVKDTYTLGTYRGERTPSFQTDMASGFKGKENFDRFFAKTGRGVILTGEGAERLWKQYEAIINAQNARLEDDPNKL